MAIEYGWSGFEPGDLDTFISGSGGRGGVVGAGRLRPRTGQQYFQYNPGDGVVNTWASYSRKNLTLGVGTASATGIARVFFRLVVAPNVSSGAIFCVGTLSSGGQQGWFALNTDRRWKMWSFNQHSAASTDPLDLEVWYRADITHVITQSGVNITTLTTGSIYTEGGTLIQTLSIGNSGTPIGTVDLPEDTACGNGSGQATAVHVDFDDLWWGQADGADQASLIFPTSAWRVSRMPPLAQGSVAQWTGDFRTQVDAPMQTGAGVDVQTNAVATQQTLFTKDSIAAAGISGVEGALVGAQIRSTVSSGNESLMLGGVAYTIPVTTAIPPSTPRKTGVNFATIGDATFDGWEFGCRNDRGTTLNLHQCYLDVLHGGTGMPAPYTDVSGPFRVGIVSYTGNGGYQTISSLGFAPQWLYICNASSSALASGFIRMARVGGTRGISLNAGAVDTRNGVIAITDTGFILGPSNNGNQNTVTYVAIGIQDGGSGAGGYHMSLIGGRIGNNLDNFDVVFPEPFSPTIAWNQQPGASGGALIKTTSMPGGDFTVGFSGTPGGVHTNLIQALTASGYQVGNGSGVQGIGTYNLGMILRITSSNSGFVHTGTSTPSGSTHTVTGLPFSPVWVAVQRENNTGGGFWRCSLTHATAQSIGWGGGNLQNNGVTAITADGFSIGSQLATAGVPIYWIALGPGVAPQGACVVNLANGADSGGIAGCRMTLGN